MQPARFKNCQEAARACGCSKTNCYKCGASCCARQDSRRAGKRRGWQQHRRRLHGSICAAHGRGDISRSRLVSRGRNHRLDPHSPGSPIAIRRTRPTGSPAEIGRASVHPTIATSHDPRLETRARPNAGHCPGDHADNPQAGRERCRSRRRRGPRCFARRSWSRFATPSVYTGARKDEWTASFEGDTFVRRCNFNWVDENGNDLPNTAATVALRKNGDLLRGRSAPSQCDRLNIE